MNITQYQKLYMPETVIIELTELCNFNCIHCYEKHQRKDLLDFNDYVNILLELKELGCFRIVFTGGEPFIRKELLYKLIKLAKDLNFYVSIISNLSLCNKKDIDILKMLHPDKIIVSLYGLSAESYSRVCKTRISPNKILNNILDLKINNINTIVQSVALKENIGEIDKIRQWCLDNDLQFTYNTIIFGREGTDKSNISHQISTNDLQRLFELDTENFINDYNAMNKHTDKQMCIAGRKKICISADGSIFPCATWRIKIGTVFKGMKYFWENPTKTLEKIRLMEYQDFECSKCSMSTMCVFCPGVNYSENSNPYIPAKSICRYSKQLYGFYKNINFDC